MIIQTKYDVGQEVWFIDYHGINKKKIRKARISCVRIFIRRVFNDFTYFVSYRKTEAGKRSTVNTGKMVYDLFPTRAAAEAEIRRKG